MGSKQELEPAPSEENSRAIPHSAGRCARCKVFDKTCDEYCVFAGVFPDTEEGNLLLLHDVYGVDQVENILYDVEPNLRKTAAATLILEAEARKSDPVYGITGVIHDLNRQISLLETNLISLQRRL